MTTNNSEAEKFDAVIRTMLSVPREEIQKRDVAWRKKMAQKKLAKALPASRASTSKV